MLFTVRPTMWPADSQDGWTKRVIRLTAMSLAACAGMATLAEPPSPSPPSEPTAAERMWVATFPLDECRHALLIVDPIQQHVAIYHVDTATGTLTLKSSRDIAGDLRLGDFNAHDPKPATLRKMLEMSPPAALSPPPR